MTDGKREGIVGSRRSTVWIRRAWAPAFAALLALAEIVGGCGPGGAASGTARTSGGEPSVARATPGTAGHAREVRGTARRDVGFRSRALLEEHFRKHGGEFGSVTREQYLRIAQELRDRPAGGDVLEFVRDDGVVTRFDRRTMTFLAFNANGVIRTCFRPRDGERYFRRQALR